MLINFCLPAYNEEKILEASALKLLAFLRAAGSTFAWRIVILDNGSTDGTAASARRLADEHPEIEVKTIKLPGRGRALKTYFSASQADVLVYMDIDLAVSLDNIATLVSAVTADGYALAIGSRLLPESKIERSWARELSSQGYNLLSRLVLGHRFSDLQCSFKAVRADVFRQLSGQIQDTKWFFDTELVALAGAAGYAVKEIPVDWSENRYDQRKSKVRIFRDSLRFAIDLIRLKIKMASLKNS